MTHIQNISIFLLRVSLGWYMFYAGITKVLNPEWSAVGFLKGAKAFTGLFSFFLQPEILPIVNFLNAWGLTAIGVALLLGVGVRLASVFGAALMMLYYLPILEFPYVGQYAFLIDEHVIYALVFVLLFVFRAGRFWGLETWCSNLPICAHYPKIRTWIG